MTLDPKWTATIDAALSDSAWDDYDEVIKKEVTDYNKRFATTIDWKILKAQLWTESGGPNSGAWTTRPMQIGNTGDKAWGVMKAHKEHSNLICSAALTKEIDDGKSSINDPKFNVRVGIAYVLTRVADYGTKITDPKEKEYVVKSGDSIEAIAAKIGTTQQNLFDLNPHAKKVIHPGDKLKYQSAAIGVTSIPVLTPEILQKRYNGNGDSTYAEKIKYCQDVIIKIKR